MPTARPSPGEVDGLSGYHPRSFMSGVRRCSLPSQGRGALVFVLTDVTFVMVADHHSGVPTGLPCPRPSIDDRSALLSQQRIHAIRRFEVRCCRYFEQARPK